MHNIIQATGATQQQNQSPSQGSVGIVTQRDILQEIVLSQEILPQITLRGRVDKLTRIYILIKTV